MRQLNFKNGFIDESQQINEFLGSIVVVGILGVLCSKSILDIFGKMSETFTNIQKLKAERKGNKLNYENNKRELKDAKEKYNQKIEAEKRESQLNKTTKLILAYNNAVDSMSDGPDKEKALNDLESMKKVLNGSASVKELKQLEKLAEQKLPSNITKVVKELEHGVASISDEEAKKYREENNISQKNIEKTIETTKSNDETQKEPDDQKNSNKEPEEHEDDAIDGDEPIDDDNDLDDEEFETGKDGKAKLSNKQDPRKIFKQRTYKRGDKIFKTKSYYSKRGMSISKDEFNKRVATWEQKNKKDKKNESLSHPWTLISLKKINENKDTQERGDICKERLVYLQYLLDNVSNKEQKNKLTDIYNAIYGITFGKDGDILSDPELYMYLDDTMKNNEGKIPGLPTNEQIEVIDSKIKAFKKLHKDLYDKYMKELETENIKKPNKKQDLTKDILEPDNMNSDSEAINKIKNLSSIYGFTNILGLESTRKPSKEDDDNKDEISKQRKDGSSFAKSTDSKDVDPDDISQEQVDKIIGISK